MFVLGGDENLPEKGNLAKLVLGGDLAKEAKKRRPRLRGQQKKKYPALDQLESRQRRKTNVTASDRFRARKSVIGEQDKKSC